MATYYVNENAQPTGEHEVHRHDCKHLPSVGSRRSLGDHGTCHSALREAKRYYTNVDGCFYCGNPCHTR